MKYCIRCNPVSILRVDEAGEDFCYIHGKEYWIEVRPDSEQEVVSTDTGADNERTES